MKLKALLNRAWLPLAKGAGRALALAGGLLMTVLMTMISRTSVSAEEFCGTGSSPCIAFTAYSVHVDWNDTDSSRRPSSIEVGDTCQSEKYIISSSNNWESWQTGNILDTGMTCDFSVISKLPSGYSVKSVTKNGNVATITIAYTEPQLSLALTPPTNITLSPTASGITYGSHDLSITAQNLQGYNATLTIAPDHGPNLTLDGTGKGGDTTKMFVPAGADKLLANKQWGYTLTKVDDSNKSTAIWNNVKDQSSNPISDIIIPESESNGDGTVTKTVCYGARLDNTSDLTKGSYSTQVQYTVTGIPKPEEAPTDLGGEICQSGNSNNDCQVDIDANMIPVKYTGDTTTPKWTAIANPEDANNKGEWYDYSESKKQWANAVTLSNVKAYKYGARCRDIVRVDDGSGVWSALQIWTTNASELVSGTVIPDSCDGPEATASMDNYKANNSIDPSDILGYWVYIPRYDYQVMRMNATDPVVQAKDFTIRFRKTGDSDTKWQRLVPTESVGSSDTINNKAWATHPAFSWCTNPDYTDTSKTTGCTELNGIWVGKFETTGTASDPTVLPGVSSLRNMTIGDQFDSAKSIGVEDKVAAGYGNGGAAFGKHNLVKATSHMLKNSEWGAATYLSASKFGAGVDNVQANTSSDYYTGGSSGSAYASNVNQSTTGNQYGIYDMSGGAWEVIMGNVNSISGIANSSECMVNPARPPYVDLYPAISAGGPFGPKLPNSVGDSENVYNFDHCTWATCGGHVLHETLDVQSVSSWAQSWGGGSSVFATSGDTSWFIRGGVYSDTYDGGIASVFSSGRTAGIITTYGFRVSLLAQQ